MNMILAKAFLFLLPCAVFAEIQVRIVASNNENNRHAEASGSTSNILSDNDRRTFQMTDDNLKTAISSYFGQRPNDVYVKSPTPWGDLFRSLNWNEVRRIMTPTQAKIISFESQPLIVSVQELINNSSETSAFHAAISHDVQNTVSKTWQNEWRASADFKIAYGIKMDVLSIGGSTNMAFSSSVGTSETISQAITVGAESGVTVTLEPGQKVIAELLATKSSMKVLVNYDVTLSGVLAVNYEELYKGHHFYSMDVNAVLNAGNLKNIFSTSEVIEIDFYSTSRVIVRDPLTKAMMYSIPILRN